MFLGCMGILALAASMTACSSDNDDNGGSNNGGNNGGTSVVYNWSTDGGFKACDHILFDDNGKDDANGVVIGNGDQNFVFKGKQTIKKGTYLLKGWVYIADGAELTIEPGTVIKGDKDTKAALIAEPGGKLIAKGTQARSSSPLRWLPVAVSPVTGAASSSAERLLTTTACSTSRSREVPAPSTEALMPTTTLATWSMCALSSLAILSKKTRRSMV